MKSGEVALYLTRETQYCGIDQTLEDQRFEIAPSRVREETLVLDDLPHNIRRSPSDSSSDKTRGLFVLRKRHFPLLITKLARQQ